MEIYTDGACVPNPGDGSWAFVVVESMQIVTKEAGWQADTTNNRMEFMAVIKALEWLPESVATTIFSDSKLLVNTFNLWMDKWESNGWKRKRGGKHEPMNLDIVKELSRLKKSRPLVKVDWIKGHAGHQWNEAADYYCNRVLETRQAISHREIF